MVRQLSRAGRRPPERLAEHIVEQGAAARGALLELALDADALLEDEPVCWGPIHALRLLGELRDPTLIGPLLGQYPLRMEYEEQEPPLLWVADAVQLIGRMGAPALEPLLAWFDDESRTIASRSAASDALAYAVGADPELRQQVIDGMRLRLAEAADRQVVGCAINTLGRIGAAETYDEVMAAYRAGRVDAELLPAGAARQMLLGGGGSNIACARHTLWERYDEHGPFPPSAE
jgi:hypothetical protein